jgi:hypothetical protein
MVDEHDERRRHCPMLGSEIAFGYCREPGAALPCRKVFDCWFETFDVQGFIQAHYDEAQIQQITSPRAGRMAAVLEAAAQARRTSK